MENDEEPSTVSSREEVKDVACAYEGGGSVGGKSVLIGG